MSSRVDVATSGKLHTKPELTPKNIGNQGALYFGLHSCNIVLPTGPLNPTGPTHPHPTPTVPSFWGTPKEVSILIGPKPTENRPPKAWAQTLNSGLPPLVICSLGTFLSSLQKFCHNRVQHTEGRCTLGVLIWPCPPCWPYRFFPWSISPTCKGFGFFYPKIFEQKQKEVAAYAVNEKCPFPKLSKNQFCLSQKHIQ